MPQVIWNQQTNGLELSLDSVEIEKSQFLQNCQLNPYTTSERNSDQTLIHSYYAGSASCVVCDTGTYSSFAGDIGYTYSVVVGI